MKNHENLHFREKPIKCGKCPMAFCSERSLAMRLIVHKKKSFKCDLCDRSFLYKASLTAHMKIHKQITLSRMDSVEESNYDSEFLLFMKQSFRKMSSLKKREVQRQTRLLVLENLK